MKRFVWLSLGVLVFAGVSMGDQMGVTGAIVPENTVSNFIYVNNQSVYASDTNFGTNASLPLKTIGKAAGIAVANNTNNIGTKIIIYPGIYREDVQMWASAKSTTAPIIFEAWSNGTAVISGSDIWTNWQQNANLYTHAWTNTWGYTNSGNSMPDGTTNLIVQRKEIVIINGSLVTQVLSLAAMQTNTFYVDDTNAATIYVWPPDGISLSDTNNVVEVGQRSILFRAQGKGCLVFRGLTLIRNTAVCWGGPGGFLYCTNVLVDSCEFFWNNGGGALGCYKCQNITVSNCVSEYNGGVGCSCCDVNNALFVDNDFSYNNWRGAMGKWTGWSQAGCKCGDVHNGVFRRQSAVGNQSRGWWFDTDNTNILVDSCFFSENLLAGIDLEANLGPIVLTNNVICYNQTGGGVGAECSGQITLNNNTIYGNGLMWTNAGGMCQVSAAAVPRWVWNWETGVSNLSSIVSWTLADNVIVATDARQRVLGITTTGTQSQAFFSTFAFNRNHMWYNNPVNSNVFVSYGYSYNFPNWKAATGFGADSTCLPMTSITSPINNLGIILANPTNMTSMTIQASAVDSDGGSDGGSISNVTFYNGTTLLGTDTTPPTPYSMVWSNIVCGSYVLKAVAWDAYVPADSRTSTPVNLQVWSDMHIGSNSGDSATSYGMTTYTLSGNGAGIYTNADDCRFLYLPTSLNCHIIARVVSCSSTSPLARVGVMMRANTNADSLEVSALFAPQTKWAYFNCRTNTGDNTSTQGVAVTALPYWLSLQLSSTPSNCTIVPVKSPDGTNWMRLPGSFTTTNWHGDVLPLVGLTVTSGDTNSTLSATFDNVAYTWCSTNGESWTDTHIGSSTGDSAASYGPTYTVSGGGAGICTNADSFRFVYAPMTGSYTLKARVVSCSSTSPLARAGVMMRLSTNANDIEASALFAPQTDWMHFYKRTATGGNTSTSGTFAAALPYWVKLSRGSNGIYYTMSPWMSSNGTTWVSVGYGGLIFTNWCDTNVLLCGLAVTGGDTNSTLTATFDNVAITYP